MKKTLSIMLVLLMILSLFAGCSQQAANDNGNQEQGQNNQQPQTPNEGATAENNTPAEPKAIFAACNFDPPTLDPHNTVEDNAGKIIEMCNEGLTRNRNGVIVPGIAESWEVSEDGYEYTFHLRDSKWSDGSPLTAYDFEYAFLRLIDPQQAYEQAEFAYDMLDNAREYHTGEMTDVSQVGIKALDEKTLYLKTDIPGVEVLSSLSNIRWVPIKKEIAQEHGPAYGGDTSKLSNNGPFKVVDWSHQEKIVVEKNENYWNADEVKLDRVTYMIVTDDLTMADMMLAGTLDVMDTTKYEVMQQLVDEGFKVKTYSTHIQSLLFGGIDGTPAAEWLDNLNFKLALNLAINRKAITDTLFTGGIPAYRLSTPTTPGVEKPFVEEYPFEGWPVEGDPEMAKHYLQLAMDELGKTADELPTLSVLCYESANTLLCIQAIQDMLKTTLGVEVFIDQLPIQQMFSKVFSSDFDLWWSGMSIGTMDWGGTDGFLASFDWRSPSYTGSWKSQEFADLYDTLRTTNDMKARKDSLFEIEKLMIAEQPPFIPVAYTQIFTVYRDNLTEPEVSGNDDLAFIDMAQ